MGQQDFLEAHEIERILAQPKRNTTIGARDYCILLVLANSPMRKGELVRLTVGALVRNGTPALEYAVLKKRKDKEKLRRVHLPVSQAVFDALQRHILSEYRGQPITPDLPLFRTSGKYGSYQKKAITPCAVDGIVRKYVKAAGLVGRYSCHSFRASYLTLRLDKGISPATLRDLAAHESLSSTEKYLRTSLTRIQDGALALQFC